MKDRNLVVDIIRGFAMLLVVLGHTMSGSTILYEGTVLFKIIWTLQMPLFIIISGYVTRYSRPLLDSESLLEFVKKRTLAYILPWLVWTIVVRGVVFGQTNLLDLWTLLWRMDSGYWFLVTIWTISMIFGISDLLSNKWFKDSLRNVLSHLIICGVGMLCLIAIGYYAGFDFCAIKLTLYYLPIYLLGYLYGKIQDWMMARIRAKTIMNCAVVLSLGLWLASIKRFDFYSGGDGIFMTMMRFTTSVLGCVAVAGLLSAACKTGGVHKGRLLKWSGIHSLEIYLTHYLFLSIVPALNPPVLSSLEGLFSLTANFTLTMVLAIVTIRLAQCNSVLNYVLYAKRTYGQS